ncbi:MAG: 50S ribosomal protein L11 methyltransferase [Desulfovibrionaceae bacterium]|nr:50S ribosomal protein L11 methyltransferase [Desulfovibrionaceae bacterium]
MSECTELIRMDITVWEPEEADIVTGILTQFVSWGWEELSPADGSFLFRVHTDNQDVQKSLREALHPLPFVSLSVSSVPKEDWAMAWRAFFTPVSAGDFVVLPPWLVNKTPLHDQSPIVIEPKSAFGTGHHNTTVLCLEALSRLRREGFLRKGERFFDVGTGTGILSIACCLYGMSGLGADIDPVAVANAKENSEINRVSDRLAISAGSAEQGGDELFDVVVANILAGPLKELAPEIMRHIAPGGCLILSGLLDVQADDVEKAYAPLGKAERMQSADWMALVWRPRNGK